MWYAKMYFCGNYTDMCGQICPFLHKMAQERK